MDLLARLFHGDLRANVPDTSPLSDYWYQPFGANVVSTSGQRVDPDRAQTVSAFNAGLRLLSNDVAKVPFEVYERLPDGGKDRARTHSLYDVIHTQPNVWQTSFEWRRQGMRDLILRGNWYCFILPGPRGFVDQLVRINPALVTPKQLTSGRLVYLVRDDVTGQSTTYTQDEIFHVRGVSDDGIEGKSVLSWARDSIGIALSTESYAARLFSQGSLHGGTITVQGLLDKEASKRMAATFVSGESKWHLPKVLEQGATYAESTLTPEDSQFLLSRQFSVAEMARWLGMPPHKLADLSRSTNNNIEHQGLEYFGDGLQPWYVLIEQSANRDLILPRDQATFFSEFNADGLMRGDSQARGEFYMRMFGVGAYSPNDILAKENMNKVEWGDQRFVPVNMRPIDQPFVAPGSTSSQTPTSTPSTTVEPEESQPSGRSVDIANASAARLLRKEVKAMQALAVKHAANQDAFAEAVTNFYAAHAGLVVETLLMTTVDAERYCASQAAQMVVGHWLAALEAWKTDDYAQGLAALALEAA